MKHHADDGLDRESTLDTAALFELADRAASRAGVRLTRVRRHVYRLLIEAGEPLSAYEIVDRLEGIACPKPPTAYRALECLERIGLVRKIRSISKFVALRSGPTDAPQAFLICRTCGSAEQVAATKESIALRERAERFGFTSLDPTIELIGRCSEHPD